MGATVASLITRVRSLSNRVGSTFVTDAEILAWLDVEYGNLYDMVLKACEGYVHKSATLAITSAQYVALPTDFYRLLRVEVVNGVHRASLPRCDPAEIRGNLMVNGQLKYCLMGTDLWFNRTPIISGTMELWYAPTPATLILAEAAEDEVDSDTVAEDETSIDELESWVQSGWEELMVMGCVWRINLKAAEDVSGILQAIAITAKGVQSSLVPRDFGEAPHIRDVYGQGGRRANRWRTPW